MIRQLFFISTVVWQVVSSVYYVESAPVAPFSCTQTHPCRLSDLPGAFTVADTIVFLPHITGVSDTYSFGTKSYMNPSIVLSAGTIYSACSLTAKNSLTANCTSASMISGSSLTTTNVGVIGLNACNFTNSQYSGTGGTAIEWNNGFITGLTGSQQFLFSSLRAFINGMSLTSSTSSNSPVVFRTSGPDESTFSAKNVIYDTVTTTAGQSAMLIQSIQGLDFALTVQNVAYNAVVSANAMLEFQVANTAGGIFYTEIDVNSFTAVGGSCRKGFMYANNGDESAQMTANIFLSSATNVDFKGGAAFVLNAPTSGTITFNANDNNINICNPANEPYLGQCNGHNTNMAFLWSGSDEGSLIVNNCGLAVYVNGDMTC